MYRDNKDKTSSVFFGAQALEVKDAKSPLNQTEELSLELGHASGECCLGEPRGECDLGE